MSELGKRLVDEATNEYASVHAADQRLQQEGENLAAAVSLHFAYYNFVRVYETLGTTPAEKPWTRGEVRAEAISD